MKNQIKIYEDLKNNFNKQKTQKKDELNNLFLSGKYKIEMNLIIYFFQVNIKLILIKTKTKIK